jgi:hypothetical protein
MRPYTTIEYECPACACTYQLVPRTNMHCPRCIDEINEKHSLVPAAVLRRRLAALKARKDKP